MRLKETMRSGYRSWKSVLFRLEELREGTAEVVFVMVNSFLLSRRV